MRFKISVNFIGEFRVAEVIATPLVGIFKKKMSFSASLRATPHPYRDKWREISLETLRTFKNISRSTNSF